MAGTPLSAFTDAVDDPRKPPPIAFMQPLVDDHAFHERAAIREYDAGFSRAKAEWLARADVAQASGAARQDRPASVSAPGTPPAPSARCGPSSFARDDVARP